ncbi:MAG: hypothetical protein ABIQ15_01350 [Nocardioides sp.]
MTIRDAGGSVETTNVSPVTLTLTTPNGGTLTCTANPKAAVAGVATFAGCKVDKAGTYTLTANGASLTSGASSSFTITAGTATKVGFASQPGGGTSQAAMAAQPAVAVQDAFGNTVTTNTSSVTLALTTPGGATLACTTNPLPGVAGVATFAGCKVDKAGTYTLSATDGGLTSSISSSFIITAGAAAKLGFTTQPGGGPGGTAMAAQPAVAVQDGFGNTVTTNTSSVTLALTTAGGATLSCTANPIAAAAGVATFAGCKVDKAGTYTLTATDSGLTSSTSSSFTIAAGAAAKLAFTMQPGGGTSQTTMPTQPVVAVQDAGGNTVTSDTSTVTLALTTPGGASLTCTTNPKAAVAGVATFAGCRVDKTGTYTLTATDGALTTATSSSFTITAGAAAKVAFTAQPGNGTSQTALAAQPVVAVQDAFGNTVVTDSSSVTLTLTTPNGAALTCTANPTAAAAGVATFAGCKVDKTATYTLTATDGVLTTASSSSFTITAGPASKLAFSTQPSSGTGGTSLATQPVVTVQDAFGNTVTTDSSSVTLALTTPAGATLSCTANPTAAAAGVATFAGCKIDKAATYTLTATDGTLTSVTSTSLTITVGIAAKLGFTTQPSGGTSQVLMVTQPVVAIQDAGGNTVTGNTSSVTLTLTTPGGATLTCTTNPKAAVAGVATFAGCKVDKAATYTLTATATSLTSATSSSLTITAGAAAKLGFTTQPSGGTSQVALATQPGVAIQDAFGNTVTGNTSSVTLALTTPGGATLACVNNPRAAVTGVSTFAGCKVDKSGTYTLAATDGTLTSATSTSFTITAGAPSRLIFVTNGTGTTPSCAGGSLAVGKQGSLTTYVAIVDSFGNQTVAPATPTTVTITSTPTSGGGNAPSPATLSVPANANPAVTSGSSVFALPNGAPVATTYTATAGSLSTSCIIQR